MLLALGGVLVGLVVLTVAADRFVVGASRVAARLNISPIVIGVVVIGFGTSAPELVVSALATARDQADLAVGNIIGSNVANLSLILGIAATITPLAVRSQTLKREVPLTLGATLLLALLVQDGLSVLDGALLAIWLVLSLTFVLRSARQGDPELESEVTEYLTGALPALRTEWLRTLLGLVGVLVAAQVLVTSATAIAEDLGVAEGFIGLTVVAVGTSLPELATAVQSARRSETELILGNLIGSNLFNATAVGAVAAFIGSGQVLGTNLTGIATLLMVAVMVIAGLFMFTGSRVGRSEGTFLMLGYLASVPWLT